MGASKASIGKGSKVRLREDTWSMDGTALSAGIEGLVIAVPIGAFPLYAVRVMDKVLCFTTLEALDRAVERVD